MFELQHSLKEIIEFGAPPSPAMSRIIFDYANYHAIMVMISGLLFLLFVFLSYTFWVKFKKMQKRSQEKWEFEKKSYFCFMILNMLVGMFMLLLVIANTTNTLNPLHGLSLAYNNSATEEALNNDTLHQTFSEWLKSSDGAIPASIMAEINNRVNFHTAKAFKSFALLILFVLLSRNRWKKMIGNARDIKLGIRAPKLGIQDMVNFSIGNLSVAISILMMIVVEANIQGAFAPLTAFLVGFF